MIIKIGFHFDRAGAALVFAAFQIASVLCAGGCSHESAPAGPTIPRRDIDALTHVNAEVETTADFYNDFVSPSGRNCKYREIVSIVDRGPSVIPKLFGYLDDPRPTGIIFYFDPVTGIADGCPRAMPVGKVVDYCLESILAGGPTDRGATEASFSKFSMNRIKKAWMGWWSVNARLPRDRWKNFTPSGD